MEDKLVDVEALECDEIDHNLGSNPPVVMSSRVDESIVDALQMILTTCETMKLLIVQNAGKQELLSMLNLIIQFTKRLNTLLKDFGRPN